MTGRSAGYSACLHLAVLLISVLGIPDWLNPSLPIVEKTVIVEIVDPDWLKTIQVTSTTNLPQLVEQPPEVKKQKQKQEQPVPRPVVSPKSGTQSVELKPEPKSKLKPDVSTHRPSLHKQSELSKQEPKLKSESKLVHQKLDSLPEQKDKKEPKPDSFDALLKNIEKLAQLGKVGKEDKKTKSTHPDTDTSNRDFEKTVAGLADAGSTQYSPNLQLSLSEIDAIRAQIERCWNVPAGVRNAGNIIIEIKVQLAPDGQVLHVHHVEDERYHTDSFYYRAAADSAKRAVYQCSPIKAPPTKYDRWREVTLRFNPHEMVNP